MLDRRPRVTKETWSGAVRDLVLKDEWRALHLFISVRISATSKRMQRLSELPRAVSWRGSDVLPPSGNSSALPPS